MKAIVSVLVATAFLAALAGPADAARKKRKHVTKHYYTSQYAPRRHASRDYARGYIERQPIYDANRMPFGTLQWWDQMVRENRAR